MSNRKRPATPKTPSFGFASHFQFEGDWQDQLLACLVAKPTLFDSNIFLLDYGYFTGVLSQQVCMTILDHWQKTGGIPSLATIRGTITSRLGPGEWDDNGEAKNNAAEISDYIDKLETIDVRDAGSMAGTMQHFCQNRRILNSITKLADDLKGGRTLTLSDVQGLQDAVATGTPAGDIEGKNVTELATAEIDHASTIIGKLRALARGGAMLVAAPTGVGKSSWMMQIIYGAACGVETLGMKFTRPMKVLVVQSENDFGDQTEMARGALMGMEHLTDEQLELAAKNTVIVHHCQHTGDEFLGFLAVLLRKHRPDLLVIDPLNAYVGADTSKAETIAKFCRNGLNPLLQQYNCAAIILHHQNKPPQEGRATKGLDTIDFRYRYAGSADLANWCRALMVIEPTDHPAIFRFILAKRGSRFGWTDAHGNPTSERFFMHSPDKIYWCEPGMGDLAELQELTVNKRREKRGGIAELYPDDDLLCPLEEAPLTLAEWHKSLKAEGSNISKSRLSERKDKLVEKNKVREEHGKFTLVKRPGRTTPQV